MSCLLVVNKSNRPINLLKHAVKNVIAVVVITENDIEQPGIMSSTYSQY